MDTIVLLYKQWGGIIPLLIGVFLTLTALGKIPHRPKDPTAHQLWLRKSAPTLRVCGYALVLFGVMTLLFGMPL